MTSATTLPHLYSGKVRELYGVDDDRLLIVASDRISVFDVVLPDDIPDKGRVLTAISSFWFDVTAHLAANHIVSFDPADFPEGAGTEVAGRAMLVRRTQPVRMECIARGYLFGGAWAEYREHGTVQGRTLPVGLREADPLPHPLFTPTTKADEGHDLPVSDAEAVELVGEETFEAVKVGTLAVYELGARLASGRGVILADTKLEWGHVDGQLLVIDEMLTPDSSRYWPAEDYQPGSSPPSFDKQYVRDHYLEVGWDRIPPAPRLPADVIAGTRARYVEAYERLTGRRLDDWYG
ncbi:MAG: phosphoribosylaminoimidazolesuccinocarboxamide synthase [Acidimicrobiia bacterium]